MMALCPNCRKPYREPPDEQGDHGCPHCGAWPEDLKQQDEDDMEESTHDA